MSIRDDLKALGSSLKKSGSVAKKVNHKSTGQGWYADQLRKESNRGIDKNKVTPSKNIARSNLMTEVLNKKKK